MLLFIVGIFIQYKLNKEEKSEGDDVYKFFLMNNK
jgi:hypothetical protein